MLEMYFQVDGGNAKIVIIPGKSTDDAKLFLKIEYDNESTKWFKYKGMTGVDGAKEIGSKWGRIIQKKGMDSFKYIGRDFAKLKTSPIRESEKMIDSIADACDLIREALDIVSKS